MYFSIKCLKFYNFGANQIHTELLKPAHFIFCIIIMLIPSMLCFSSFLTISYCFPWCFPMFPFLFLQFPWVFLLFPLSVSPVSYFRFYAGNKAKHLLSVSHTTKQVIVTIITIKFFENFLMIKFLLKCCKNLNFCKKKKNCQNCKYNRKKTYQHQ